MNFILTRNHGISSLLIRARLWDEWSHALVRLDGPRIIDSTFKHGGVRERELAHAIHGATARAWVTAPLDREREADEWLREQVGKDYDWRAIYGFATFTRDWHDDYAWFCFELIAGMIEQGSAYRFASRNRVAGKDLIHAAAVLRGEA